MKKRSTIISTVFSMMAAATLTVATAPSASAATYGGIIWNRSDSTGNVRVSPSRPFNSSNSRLVYPGSDSVKAGVSNVQCFYPLKRAVSQYGGIYNAYEIRCMASDNVGLYLKVG